MIDNDGSNMYILKNKHLTLQGRSNIWTVLKHDFLQKRKSSPRQCTSNHASEKKDLSFGFASVGYICLSAGKIIHLLYFLYYQNWRSIGMTCMMKVNLTFVFKAKHSNIVFITNCIRSNKQNSRVVINNTSLFPGPLLFCPLERDRPW